MMKMENFDALKLSMASPETIISWSHGEITKPETINYRTLRPERDGLFCERIFGPVKDWECACGKYKRYRYKGIICDKCGVEVTRAKVRRERMGHIKLATPVSHIWYFKGVPSRMGLLLDMSPRNLEKVIYYAAYLVTSVDESQRQKALDALKADHQAAVASLTISDAEGEHVVDTKEVAKLEAAFDSATELVESLDKHQVITDAQYRELHGKFPKLFKAGMGAEAVRVILAALDINALALQIREEVQQTSGAKRVKAVKRLKVVEAFHVSRNNPSWMVLDVLPVIPPELRPMVQLDGGRFATSDLNDLYRRVINRNNRLKKLLEIGAPDIIVRNEKRMLQEAVDALVDNGRRGRPIVGTNNRRLKSLSDMLKGKQGRFRQNLLGKRVDYSGRSVIVVGPELKVHECGLPKKMALELFKPFIMKELFAQGLAPNIRSAKRMVERMRPEVWDVLDTVIKDHPVLLNRAPTLHRLSIQAFMPVLIEGQAIQLHPLVCHAFNADFDGDQMAVHVPLFAGAVSEAKNLMLSSKNVLSAANGLPVITPSQDIVLGSYYLTQQVGTTPKGDAVGKLPGFASLGDVAMALESEAVEVHDFIRVRVPENITFNHEDECGETTKMATIVTTVGRVVFNDVLPVGEVGNNGGCLSFHNEVMDLKHLRGLVQECYELYGSERTAEIINEVKRLGFKYATQAGITISAMDIKTPNAKYELVEEAEKSVAEIEMQFRRGLITDEERYLKTVELWTKVTDEVTAATMSSFDPLHSVLMMSQSGARGSVQQIRQLVGMRGLMADPSGRIIDLPIKANFSEGLSVLEYFISTHGARKGLADTALRTADSGYLTRRLVDVAQDVIVREEDCQTTGGVVVHLDNKDLGDKVIEQLRGRMLVDEVSLDGKTLEAGSEISDLIARKMYANRENFKTIKVRSVMNCKARDGICRYCYGRNLATGKLVEVGEAVGVIAAQSIGEPGTQLTMRTFHTGGVATGGSDITQGLPRVEEVFEARIPKGKAIISEIEGDVHITHPEGGTKGSASLTHVKVSETEEFSTTYKLEKKATLLVTDGAWVAENAALASSHTDKGEELVLNKAEGTVQLKKNEIIVHSNQGESREYVIPVSSQLCVENGQHLYAGDKITEGSISPQELLLIQGKDAVQTYLVEEVQKVYRSQGVDINDKHIEVVVRQMLRKVRIDEPGDTTLIPGEIVALSDLQDANSLTLAEGGEPAIGHTILLGLIKAALNTSSWLSAASFQETTRVLTEAAIGGKIDHLKGLKENVIIGKLIPAGTGFNYYQNMKDERAANAEEVNPADEMLRPYLQAMDDDTDQ